MDIKLNTTEYQSLIEKLQDYFDEHHDFEVGQIDADFLLDFIGKEFVAVFYNQGLYDAQTMLQTKIDTLVDDISELEKSVN